MRRLLFAAPLAVALAGGAMLAAGDCSGAEGAAEVLVATSVCEAHELRALQQEDPDLEIEIPQKFDSPWPSREACLSYQAADDPEAPGPLQPIPFSHKHHSGLYQIDCLYCHSGTERSQAAGVPSVELCMGCHEQFPPSYDEFEGIRTLKEHWEQRKPIQWQQIHRLPEYVQFRHNSHVRAEIDCQRCHGPVEEMDKLSLVADTIWWPWGLPSKTLEMGWCVDCHRQKKVSQDCVVCHY